MKFKAISGLTLFLLIASFAMAQIPCGPTINPLPTLYVNWTQYRFDMQHTGCNPYETVLSTATVGGLVLDWTYPTAAPVYGDPAVVSGVVYFTSNNYPDSGLYAVNAKTGALLWSNAQGNGTRTPPTVTNGVVYIGQQTPNAGVYAFDAATGDLLWHYATTYTASEVLAIDGVLYAGTDFGLVALDASTGTILWMYGTDGGVQAPALANGVLYFNSIYFSYPDTYVNTLYALDIASRQPLWQYQWTLEDDALINPPIVGNGKVYFHSYAFDAKTGSIVWNSQTYFDSTPALANGVLYVGSTGSVVALNANTGVALWEFGKGAYVSSSPSVANGVVYSESEDGNLYALNASTGALLWQYKISNQPGASGPAIANGNVYIGSFDKNLYAYHLPGH